MSELSDRLHDTAELPSWPGPLETRTTDGGIYAQLHADLWTLERHLAGGGRWPALAASVRNRLWSAYPEYLAAATRQRLMEAGAAAGIRTQPQCWGYWVRRWGDPLLELRRRLEWFLTVVEASP